MTVSNIESNADFIASVHRARERIKGFALRFPLVRLSHPGGSPAGRAAARPIFLKLENLQPVGSFKIRCGTNALLSCSPDQQARGVATASAGNFAQGLAFAGRQLGVPVTAVVPDTAARSKIEALEGLGARIVVRPYLEWWELLEKPPRELEGRTFIHPVSDPEVIAGNGTLGLEILEDLPDVDCVIAPYGGGGLCVGIASYLKAVRPVSRVYACETEAGRPVAAAFAAGRPQEVSFNSKTFVTGMGSRRVLDSMWPLVQRFLDGAVEVSLAETARAIRLLITHHHVVAEGAGGAPVAAAIKGVPGEGPIVCVVSGGHLDPGHIRAILEGAEPPDASQ